MTGAAEAREAARLLLQDLAFAALQANRNLAGAAEAAMAHGSSLEDVNREVRAIQTRMVAGTPPLALTHLGSPQTGFDGG